MCRRSLLCVLVLMILLGSVPQGTLASPEAGPFRCRLKLTLDAEGILGDPFDRWAEELADMVAPDIEYLSWPEGQLLNVDMLALGKSAFRVQLLNVGDRVAMSSSLMGDGQVLLSGDQLRGALELMETVRGALQPETDWPNADCTLTLNAGHAIEHLLGLQRTLLALADTATGDTWENVRALGALCEAFAELTQKVAKGTPVLSVYVHYGPPEARQAEIAGAATDAPKDLLATLSLEAPMAVVRAIANEYKLDSG